MSQVYMTAKLNLSNGTILYPQISLDNMVKSISDPTAVTVVTTVGASGTANNNQIPTAAAVRSLADTKQNTLTEGPGVNIDANGTISFNGTTLDVTTIYETVSNGVHLQLDGSNVTVQAALAADDSAGVLAGAADGVTIDQGIVKANLGDGLLVTEGGKAAINEATVEQVLQGGTATWTEGASGWSQSVVLADDKVDTPANLRGALTVAQAVDVSCKATYCGWTDIQYEGDSTWYPVNGDAFIKDTSKFLGTFKLRVTGTIWYYRIGFGSSAGNKFPKRADNLKYLVICDVKNTGSMAWVNGYLEADGSSYPNNNSVSGVQRILTTADCDTGNDGFTRLAVLFDGSVGSCDLAIGGGAQSKTYEITIKNWRQYEVTALTDDAIAYIAGLPDPDQFFRSSTIFQVRDKYLVKQDMVCPWIYTINMPDDSDLTVAAGLSYKIKYVNDTKDHNVTVDTIPTDAYGWDTHVQMFVKGASKVKFHSPLVLMNPLSENSGHNLLIKYRNGQALVYVEDTDAGYVVTVTAGTESGTFYDGLTYTDSSETGDRYIVFGTITDGNTCEVGTVSVNQDTSVLGNGIGNTIVSGTFAVRGAVTIDTVPYPARTMNMQDLSISGSTFNGAGFTNFTDVGILGDFLVPTGTTVSFSGNNVLGGTISGTGYFKFNNGSVLDGVDNSGVLNILTEIPVFTDVGFTWKNLTVTGTPDRPTNQGWINAAASSDGITEYVFENCVFDHFSGSIMWLRGGDYVKLKGCTIKESNTYWPYCMSHREYKRFAAMEMEDCISLDPLPGGLVPRVYTACGFVSFVGNNSVTDITGLAPTGTSDAFQAYVFAPGSTTTVMAAVDIAPNKNAKVHDQSGTITVGYYDKYTWTASASTVNDYATIILNGHTISLSGSTFSYIHTDATVADLTCAAVDVWTGAGVVFVNGVDAHNVNIMKLSGTTFSQTAKLTGLPDRVQIPAAATVSVRGNSAASDSDKILEATMLLVGNNPATPTGSATLEYTSGGNNLTSSIRGVGTYIAKDGSNDFTTNVAGVGTSDGLGAIFTDPYRWARIYTVSATSAVAPANANINAVSEGILDHAYAPIIRGDYTVTSGGTMTVTRTTKTTVITGAPFVASDVWLGKDATLVTSGGVRIVDGAKVTSGTIDFGGASGFDLTSSGWTLNISGATLTNGNRDGGGALHLYSDGQHATVTSCVITGNTGANGGGIYTYGGAGSAVITAVDCVVSGNTGTNGQDALVQLNGILHISGGTYGIVQVVGHTDITSAGSATVDGAVRLDYFGYFGAYGGPIIIGSGAVIDLTDNSRERRIDGNAGGVQFHQGGTTVKCNAAGPVSSCFIAGATVGAIGNACNVVQRENSTPYRNIYVSGTAQFSGVTIDGNKGGYYFWFAADTDTATFTDCTFVNYLAIGTGVNKHNGKIYLSGTITRADTAAQFITNVDGENYHGIIEITDNTVIDMSIASATVEAIVRAASIKVGANVKIKYKNGTTVITTTVAAGTYTNCTLLANGTIS